MSSEEWTESGRDTSGVGRLGYDDTAPSKLMIPLHIYIFGTV